MPELSLYMVGAIRHLMKGISVKTSFLSLEGGQLRFLDVGLEASLDDGVRIGSGNLNKFSDSGLNDSGDGIGCYSQLSALMAAGTKWSKHDLLC